MTKLSRRGFLSGLLATGASVLVGRQGTTEETPQETKEGTASTYEYNWSWTLGEPIEFTIHLDSAWPAYNPERITRTEMPGSTEVLDTEWSEDLVNDAVVDLFKNLISPVRVEPDA